MARGSAASTIWCGMSSLLTQVTLVPGATLSCAGVNVKLSIVMVASAACTAPEVATPAVRTKAVLGGIWECWKSPIGDRMRTLAIVTTPASADLAAIHDRMPLVLDEADWPVWLGESEGDATALMRPAPPDRIVAWRVGRAVGNRTMTGRSFSRPRSRRGDRSRRCDSAASAFARQLLVLTTERQGGGWFQTRLAQR